MFHLCGFKGTLCKNLNMSAPLVITFVSGSGGYEGASGCCPVSPAESDGDGGVIIK